MASTPPQGNNSPPKPWERSGAQSNAAPFEASAPGRSTSDIVENSGVAKPGEVVPINNNGPLNRNTAAGLPPTNGNNVGAYGSSFNYNNSTPYGYGAAGYGGAYGGSLYVSNLYNRGYGGSYGGYGSYGGLGSYGGMYNGNYGGSYGNYGMGMGMGGPYNELGPDSSFGQPVPPPGFWISFINMMGSVVQAFNRISMLVNENTSALHMLMNALLQVFGNSGRLYGELAPFVLRVLGRRPRNTQKLLPEPPHPAAPLPAPAGQKLIEGSMAGNAGMDKYWNN